MRKLVLKMSMSIDGFVAGPDGALDWIFRTRAPDSTAWVADTIAHAGLHALGSRSFHGMASHWSTSTDILAPSMNDIPKVVFTRQASFEIRATDPRWASARIASGDLAEQMQRLKQEPGDYILAQGGASFARSLVALGLVDEYRLVVHPVVLGSGEPLFSALPQPVDLQLVSTERFVSGVVANVYRPVGT